MIGCRRGRRSGTAWTPRRSRTSTPPCAMPWGRRRGGVRPGNGSASRQPQRDPPDRRGHEVGRRDGPRARWRRVHRPGDGSHGGATADGQLEVLASLGITGGIHRLSDPVEHEHRRDRRRRRRNPGLLRPKGARRGRRVIPINRVKPHTDFSGPVESGLLKMIAIGLGKQRGADAFHSQGFASFADLIPVVAGFTLAHSDPVRHRARRERACPAASRRGDPGRGDVRARAGAPRRGGSQPRPATARRNWMS